MMTNQSDHKAKLLKEASPVYDKQGVGFCDPECRFFEKNHVDQRTCRCRGEHHKPFHFTGMENRICFAWAIRSQEVMIQNVETERKLKERFNAEEMSKEYHYGESRKYEKQWIGAREEARAATAEATIIKGFLLEHIPTAEGKLGAKGIELLVVENILDFGRESLNPETFTKLQAALIELCSVRNIDCDFSDEVEGGD